MSDLTFDKSTRHEFQKYCRDHFCEDKLVVLTNGLHRFVSMVIDTYITNERYRLDFMEVKFFLTIEGSEEESNDDIQSLSVEEDYSRFYDSPHLKRDDIESYLYFLLRTKSGDELHIVSEIVYITVF